MFVCDEGGGCESLEKIEDIVLKDEKVALGMKAFRTVRMHPDHAAEEPLIAGEGSTVPRMVFVEPTKMKVTVLEEKKIKASALYSSMKRVAAVFYKEKLDKVVKSHLKILGEQDKLANEERNLASRKERLEGDDAKAKALEEELAALQAEKAELRRKKLEIWKLTPKTEA